MADTAVDTSTSENVESSEGTGHNAELLALQRIDEASTQLQQQGNYLGALECMERGLVLRQHFFGADSDEVWRACKSVGEMCNLLAMTYLQQQDFDMALELLKKAEILTERDDAGKAVTFNNLACYYRRQGKLNQALTHLQKALKIEARLDGVKNAADTHLNMCAVLSQLGHHSAALEHAQSSLILMQEELFSDTSKPLSEKADRVAVLAICYHNIGVEQEFLKKFSESLNSYRKGVEVASQHLGSTHGIVITLRNSMVAAKKALAIHKQKEKVRAVASSSTKGRGTGKGKKGRGRGRGSGMARNGGLLGSSRSMNTFNTTATAAGGMGTSMSMNSLGATQQDVEEARRLEQSQPRALRRGAPGGTGGDGGASNQEEEKAEAVMPTFPSGSKCLLQKHLTPALFKQLADKVSSSSNSSSSGSSGGVGLGTVIKSAVACPEGGVGAFAGDEGCFDTFGPLFRPLVSELHSGSGYKPGSGPKAHPRALDPVKLQTPKSSLAGMEAGANVVRHITLVATRSLGGVKFAPALDSNSRVGVEKRLQAALATIKDGGSYTALAQASGAGAGMKGDKYWEASGCGADWPSGRGVFSASDSKLRVHINCGGDVGGGHLVITTRTTPLPALAESTAGVASEGNHDIKDLCERYLEVEKVLSKAGMSFAFGSEYGYLNADLSKLGAGLVVTVRMALPLTSKEPAFNDLLENYELEAVPVPGGVEGEFDIRNRHMLGVSEEKLVQHVFDGAAFFANIELEQRDS